ncbi:hypothetical protein HNQ51_000932 [Inhella inkyongensis]|uniref:N-acyl amino acid synthase FeeM catalytic core domain-containing protein n=1 Tax=Inhella inkyongensis TaxID=392593 RepID=A0A840S576_9BURK|nr:long-chain N-acyl amino acid synthase [Inhella inkyongensis]MBB5203639.1 hypothetical protein [Inhella inkyongensis]
MSESFVESMGSGFEASQWAASGFAGLSPEPRSSAASGYSVERVRSLASWRTSQALVGRRYGQRGLRVKPQGYRGDAGLSTLQVHENGELVGTLSVRMDGVLGLSADTVFPDEMQALRDRGLRLCEFTRLAVEGGTESKQVLARLFHQAHMVAYRLSGAEALVFEVHPRHVPFYRRMLGAKVLSGERINPHVNAPAVLMMLDLEEVQDQVELYGGRPELASKVRCIYPLVYGPDEEPDLLRQLALRG